MLAVAAMQAVHALMALQIRLAGMSERRRLGGGPVLGEDFGLFEDGLGGLFLFVGWVAVPAEDATDEAAEVGSDVFAGVQSVVTLLRTVSTSSRAMSRRVSSPRICTALSLVWSAS